MNREDFNMLQNNFIYFDNGATTLKPKILSQTISEYYNEYSANAHRGDYEIGLKVDAKFEETRNLIMEFINANNRREIIFTSGATDSLNKIVNGYFKHQLQKNDEVLITKSEHASNVLPWFILEQEIGIKVKYIELNSNLEVTLNNIQNSITEKTKAISLAYITNVVGDIRNIKQITDYAHQLNILVVVDGAQSVAHLKTDVQQLDIDFLAFSAHKMLGPTGVGVLYGKEKYLEKMKPTQTGGGMNASFISNNNYQFHNLPTRLEAGTQNIAGVIGFGSAIKYLNNIGMDNIFHYEKQLKDYAIKQLKQLDNIIIYNEKSESGIITFNMKDMFAQDLAIYLNQYNICVRAGNHCAKMLKEEINVKNTCRISLYFYNTTEEIDNFISILKNPKIKEELIF